MTDLPSPNPYLDALRDDLPTRADETRIRQRLAAAGLAVTVTSVGQGAAAAVAGAKPVGFFASLSQGFAGLPMLGQVGLVAAATAIAASGPVVLITKATLPEHPTVAVSFAPRDATQDTNQGATRSAVSSSSSLQALADAQNAVRVQVVPNEATAAIPSTAQRSSLNGARVTHAVADESGSSLAEETRLIDAALLAIRAGKLEEAARLLRAHAERFPSGKLARERERTSEKLREAAENGLR